MASRFVSVTEELFSINETAVPAKQSQKSNENYSKICENYSEVNRGGYLPSCENCSFKYWA